MKKTFYVLIIILLMFNIVGCQSKKQELIYNSKDSTTKALQPIIFDKNTTTKITENEPEKQASTNSDEDKVISKLNYTGTRKIVFQGITYEIERVKLSKDKQESTGREYEEYISKTDLRLPLDKQIVTIIKKYVI